MITEDIFKDKKTGIIELIYDGEYPSDEEILVEVQKYFGKREYRILEIESDGINGKVFIK